MADYEAEVQQRLRQREVKKSYRPCVGPLPKGFSVADLQPAAPVDIAPQVPTCTFSQVEDN